jgi:hypothetical protein
LFYTSLLLNEWYAALLRIREKNSGHFDVLNILTLFLTNKDLKYQVS